MTLSIIINLQVFDLAVEAINNIFFIGIQEEYDISVKVMLKELNITLNTVIKKERDQKSSKSIALQKKEIKSNDKIISRMREVNSFDVELYNLGKRLSSCFMSTNLLI
jgi:hypothetical protein